MSILGINAGLPILAIAENSPTGVWLVTGRDAARLLITMPIIQTSGPGGDVRKLSDRSLSISAGTVQKHLEHIYDKLGVRTRAAAAVALADRLGRSMAPLSGDQPAR